ncbi:hypothetical protein ABZX12_07940 [Kribbella sp. NPDC003505]|uniref:hypothetical protein n=1 Tax=Kribbella sp. NPDC003505 TaxID=3154448 RepID=UPI0033B61F54
MSTNAGIMAAALALQEFTLTQLAAYCRSEPAEISEVMESLRPLVERSAGNTAESPDGASNSQFWHVVQSDALRELLAEEGSRSDTSRASGVLRSPDSLASLRLLRAEETLVDCAAEESADVRRVMAMTAKNYLRQFVAEGADRLDWWALGAEEDEIGASISKDWVGKAPRLRVDLALATLTESEALGHNVPGDFLIETAAEVCELGIDIDRPRHRTLAERFFDLADQLTRRPFAGASRVEAPERLLSAVGWRRVRAQVEPDVDKAAQEAVSLLRWLVEKTDDLLAGSGDSDLYRFLGHMPDGRNRIAVYSDLLQIVPSQYDWQPEDEVVPGLLVEGLADSKAAVHLEQCANVLEASLAQTPFQSDSALIGLAAHVFQDLAARGALVDREVLPRSNRARVDLLGLADVRARTTARTVAGPNQSGPADWLYRGEI